MTTGKGAGRALQYLRSHGEPYRGFPEAESHRRPYISEGPLGQQFGESRQDDRLEVQLQGGQRGETLRPRPGGSPGESKPGSGSGTLASLENVLDPPDLHCLICQMGIPNSTARSCRNLCQ